MYRHVGAKTFSPTYLNSCSLKQMYFANHLQLSAYAKRVRNVVKRTIMFFSCDASRFGNVEYFRYP